MLEQAPSNDLQSPDNMQMQALSITNSGVHATIMAEWKTSTKPHVGVGVAIIKCHATNRNVDDSQTTDARCHAEQQMHYASVYDMPPPVHVVTG